MARTEEMKIEYVDHMGDDLRVVNSARVSFNKQKENLDKKDEKLISYLAKHKHWTPFSHPQICVRITAPIFIARQWFKSTIGLSRNEVSRRYVDDEPEFWIPEDWMGRPDKSLKQGAGDCLSRHTQDHADKQYHHALKVCKETYESLLRMGVAPQQARAVLPQSMYTSWYETGSLAAFARIYGLRVDEHAQYEIQELAKQLEPIIKDHFPVSWEALKEE